jgi:hypothetical protein
VFKSACAEKIFSPEAEGAVRNPVRAAKTVEAEEAKTQVSDAISLNS